MDIKKPVALLLSKVGRGKTSFYNKLCGQQERADFGGQSCTKNLFLKPTKFGQGFYLMDTPGFGCDEDIIIHLSSLFVAAERPLNAIIVLTKFDRSCVMKDEINQALSMLSPCRQMIIIVVTFWDDAEKESVVDQQKFKMNIEYQVMKPLKLNSFICTSLNTPGYVICQQLDELIDKNVKKSVSLTPQEFSYQFTQHSSFSIQDELETHKLKVAFKNKCDGALKFIEQQQDNNQEMAELMHELILAIKEEAHAAVMQFTKQNRKQFDKLVEKFGIGEFTYLAHTKLKSIIMGCLEEVIQKALAKMQTYKFHIYNYIKQCPYCGLIWFKVYGCDGLTYCGERPEQDDEELAPQPKKFCIKLYDSKVEVSNKQPPIKQQKPINQTNSNQITATSQIQKPIYVMGCRRQIEWKSLPPLSEDTLNELKATGYLDVLNMLKDKDSKDIENEKQYWVKFYQTSDQIRVKLDKQIMDCEKPTTKKEQEIHQKEMPMSNQQNLSSNHLNIKPYILDTKSNISLENDKIKKKKKKALCGNQSCSIS